MEHGTELEQSMELGTGTELEQNMEHGMELEQNIRASRATVGRADKFIKWQKAGTRSPRFLTLIKVEKNKALENLNLIKILSDCF